MTMDDLLKNIEGSVDSTIESIAKIIESVQNNEKPVMIEELMKQHNIPVLEGVSLLTLKNNSLLSYLNNLVLILMSRLQQIDGEHEDELEELEEIRAGAVQNTIIQRVTLEKGIKPLEKRLSYQLDKMIRSYKRMETEEEETMEKLENGGKDSDGSDEEDEEEDDDDSSDEDDNLAYRPDVKALAKQVPSSSRDGRSRGGDSSSSTASGEKYKPPKISAVAPPKSIPTSASGSRNDNRKLQSMEEYLKENSDQPLLESSIGATIINNGKGGVKTNKEREKEKEIQTYEETNFTRLPNAATKKSFKQKQSELVNNFGGEDWSIFNNKRNVSESVSRKRKPNTAWDRAKKRRQ